jgi:hypothetical protein
MALTKEQTEDFFELLSRVGRLFDPNTDLEESPQNWRLVGEQYEKISQWKHDYYTGKSKF